MPFPALGFEERLGIGVEAHNAYATKVAPDVTTMTESCGLEKVQAVEPILGRFGPVRGYRGTSAGQPRRVTMPSKVQGPISLGFQFGDTQMLLAYAALCKDNGSGVPVGYTFTADIDADATSGANEPNRHVFKMQNHTLELQRAFSLHRFNGQRQDAFLGCYLRSWELNVPESGPAIINAEFLGKDILKAQADAQTAIDVSGPGARITEMAVSFGSVGGARSSLTTFANVYSASLRLSHSYREIAGSKAVDNSLSTTNPILQPLPNDFSAVSGSFRCDWNENTWQDLIDATTITGRYICLEIRLTSEVLTVGGVSPFEFIARMPAAVLTGGYPKDPGGLGPIPQEVSFEADVFDTGSVKEVLDLEFYNDQTSLTAGGRPLE